MSFAGLPEVMNFLGKFVFLLKKSEGKLKYTAEERRRLKKDIWGHNLSP